MAPNTRKQYEGHLQKLKAFCITINHTDYLHITVNIGLTFLRTLMEQGKSYSTINSARSALSQFVNCCDCGSTPFGENIMVRRFMKGIFRTNPSKPKYQATWDVKILLDDLRKVTNDSNLKQLSIKLVCLLALVTGQRMQTLAALDMNFMVVEELKYSFHIAEILKTTRPGSSPLTIHVNSYREDLDICPLECLKNYIKITENLRSTTKIFVTLQKPHTAATSQTLSRWVSLGMSNAGIDKRFSSHSTRHASTSKAAQKVSINDLLKTVGWSNEQTFAKFYRRESTDNGEKFTKAVLSKE